MTQQPPPPDIERVKQRAAKVQEICRRADAGILILDHAIGQLEEQIRSSPLYRYHLNKAKRLLSVEPKASEGNGSIIK
ncbi:MAG: hypothetical protein JOZ78_04495 [Chroococcidiopsidaceae cyanobacterium CP_BM_ER_R8_30]|nr:hypothetical protein [Chroococcidiopsidaceae cyanobacterium CP_BM_ER_R8_30]